MATIDIKTDSRTEQSSSKFLATLARSNAIFQIGFVVVFLALWEYGAQRFDLQFWISSPSARPASSPRRRAAPR